MRKLFLFLCTAVGTAICVRADTVPSDALVETVRQEFLALPRPLEYDATITYNFVSGDWATLSLKGATKAFADAHAIPELAYALWRHMDGPPHDAEALIILMGKLGGGTFVGEALSYRDATDVGNWPKFGDTWIHSCKNDIKEALGKLYHEGWYPHKVLFDADTVVAERKDPVKRTAHVEAMRAALRDPTLRVENPLGVEDILGLLSQLHATEAAPDVAPYFFYSWKQRGTFRANPGSLEIGLELLAAEGARDVGAECLALSFLARGVGRDSMPLVLEQYSNTTAEDRLVAEGGGCAPLFFLHYAVLLRIPRAEAVAAIDGYVQAHPGLSPGQTDALNGLRTIIQSGQYQTDRSFFDIAPGWEPIPPP
jgi:hypothetical protein